MAAAIAGRGKILGVIETLAIGAAGGALFLVLQPAGRADLRRHDRGRHRRDRRPALAMRRS